MVSEDLVCGHACLPEVRANHNSKMSNQEAQPMEGRKQRERQEKARDYSISLGNKQPLLSNNIQYELINDDTSGGLSL